VVHGLRMLRVARQRGPTTAPMPIYNGARHAQPPCLQQALFSSVLRHADLTSWLEALPCTLVWPSAVSSALPVLACCNNISFHNHTLHSRLQHASVPHTLRTG
jgi:hypothetical protein